MGDSITKSIKEGLWIIPAKVGIDDALTLQDKLLYAKILSLTRQDGFCFATNSYLSNLNNVTPKTISNSISNLKKIIIYELNITRKKQIKIKEKYL